MSPLIPVLCSVLGHLLPAAVARQHQLSQPRALAVLLSRNASGIQTRAGASPPDRNPTARLLVPVTRSAGACCVEGVAPLLFALAVSSQCTPLPPPPHSPPLPPPPPLDFLPLLNAPSNLFVFVYVCQCVAQTSHQPVCSFQNLLATSWHAGASSDAVVEVRAFPSPSTAASLLPSIAGNPSGKFLILAAGHCFCSE